VGAASGEVISVDGLRAEKSEEKPMNRSLAIAAAVLMAASFTPGQKGTEGGLTRGDDDSAGSEREIRDLEAQLARAVVHPDRAFYERVLAGDFTHTSHSGVFKTRAEWLAEDKFGREADPRAGRTVYEAFDVDDLAVRVYGDTAVVTGRSTPKGTDAKGQPIRGRYRFQRVWVKRHGRWQAVAFQGTRIAGT
jgi:ketosteroid isomerase-like protein